MIELWSLVIDHQITANLIENAYIKCPFSILISASEWHDPLHFVSYYIMQQTSTTLSWRKKMSGIDPKLSQILFYVNTPSFTVSHQEYSSDLVPYIVQILLKKMYRKAKWQISKSVNIWDMKMKLTFLDSSK